MKSIIFALFSFSLLLNIACTAQTTKAASADTSATAKPVSLARKLLQWDSDFVEYGKVKKGEKRNHTYKFQNISKEDVEILICSACDCTTLEWTSKVVKPGEFGEVETVFDSSEKNAQEKIVITIVLKNEDPVLHYPIIDEVSFHFDLEK